MAHPLTLHRHPAFSIFVALAIVCVVVSGGASQQHHIRVQKIEADHLIYLRYDLQEAQQVDLSDLILSETVLRTKTLLPYPLNSTWSEVPDFKILLLQQG